MNAIVSAVKWASIIGLLFLGMVFGLTVMPTVEGTVWPVVTEMKISDLHQDDLKLTFAQTINKVRDCPVTLIRYQVSRKMTPWLDVVVINEFGAPTGTVNRPLGHNTYAPFKTNLPFGFDNTQMTMRAVISYDCHLFWNTTQTLQLLP